MFSITYRIGINFFNCLIFNKILTETNENDVVIKMGPWNNESNPLFCQNKPFFLYFSFRSRFINIKELRKRDPSSKLLKFCYDCQQEEQLYRTDQLENLTKFTVINIK